MTAGVIATLALMIAAIGDAIFRRLGGRGKEVTLFLIGPTLAARIIGL